MTSDQSPSLARLLRNLVNDLATLVRQEITLAKTEVRRNVRNIVGHAGQIAVGGGVALVGALVLVAFLIVGLGVLLGGAYWLSSLLVAILLLAVGGGMGYFGAKRLTAGGLAPTATIETLGETKEWAGEEIRELRGALTGRATGWSESSPAALPRTVPGIRSLDAARPSPTGAAAAEKADDGGPPLSMPLHKRVLSEIMDDDVPGQAAKVAFFMFSSLPPALLVVFSLTGLLGGDGVADYITGRLQAVLPGSADQPETAAGFVSRFVEEVVHDNAPGPLSMGLLLGLWASSAVFIALSEALNRAFDVVETRSWFRKRAIALAVMLGFALLFLGGSVVLLAGPRIADALNLGGVGSLVWSIAQWPLAFALVVAAFYMVYYVLPNRDQAGCRRTLIRSSAIAAALWLLATLAFRLYISNFGSYSVTYGFVGAVMVILLWMYLTSLVILVGGEISSEMERSRV